MYWVLLLFGNWDRYSRAATTAACLLSINFAVTRVARLKYLLSTEACQVHLDFIR